MPSLARHATLSLVLSFFAASTARAQVIWPSATGGNDHAYELVTQPRATFPAARADALSRTFMGRRAYLATITTPAEWAFVQSLPGFGPGTWIGGSDARAEGTWEWLDGPESGQVFYQEGTGCLTFCAWNPGEPNDTGNDEDFLECTAAAGAAGWNDLIPQRDQAYLVEYDPPPVDCLVSAFGPFGPCLPMCGPGRQTRTRTVIKRPMFGGMACPPLTEVRDCVGPPCDAGLEDSGSDPDTGSLLDAGNGIDAGSGVDAGSVVDGGSLSDAGGAPDASSVVDANGVADAASVDLGSLADLGSQSDAFIGPEAGSAVDSAVSSDAALSADAGVAADGATLDLGAAADAAARPDAAVFLDGAARDATPSDASIDAQTDATPVLGGSCACRAGAAREVPLAGLLGALLTGVAVLRRRGKSA